MRCSRKPSRSNSAKGIGCQNVARAFVGIQSEQNRDQPADDMSVAVTPKRENRSAGAVGPHGTREPNLAGATLDLVLINMRLGRKRSECTAELDDVPIAIVPFVEQGEVVADLVDRHNARASASAVPPPLYLRVYLRAFSVGSNAGNRATQGAALHYGGSEIWACPEAALAQPGAADQARCRRFDAGSSFTPVGATRA